MLNLSDITLPDSLYDAITEWESINGQEVAVVANRLEFVHDGPVLRLGCCPDPTSPSRQVTLWAPGTQQGTPRPTHTYYETWAGVDPDADNIVLGGQVLGEITPGNVYIHPPVQLRDAIGEFENLRWDEFLSDALDAAVDPERAVATEAQTAEASIAALSSYLERNATSHLDTLRSSIEAHADRILMYEREIQSSTRAMRMARRECEQAEAAREHRNLDTVRAEWQRVVDHPRIESARIDDDTVVLVTTDDVTLGWPDEGVQRWLGRFEIRFGLDLPTFRFNNLSTRRAERDHPHVTNGTPCLGDSLHTFTEIHARGEWEALIDMIFGYLETFNPEDDYGRYASYWFERPDARPQEAEVVA